MDRWVAYKNGNYTVMIDTVTGTKIRKNDLDFFRADFPESMDLKITNSCDMGCAFCHENSTPNGKHSNLMGAGFIDLLHPYTEIAIGGGNPLEHPDLIPFLRKCKDLKLIPSMTVHQHHFLKNLDLLRQLRDEKLIYGLGISINSVHPVLIANIKEFPNAVCHIINGVASQNIIEALAHNNLKILILGYKVFRRGEKLYYEDSETIEAKKTYLYNNLETILKENWFNVVSFDNLAIKQLEPSRLLTEKQYEQFFMGNDGTATMFVDLVEENFAVSSTSTERFPLMDTIEEMFSKIRTN